jgi:hypothetical protein
MLPDITIKDSLETKIAEQLFKMVSSSILKIYRYHRPPHWIFLVDEDRNKIFDVNGDIFNIQWNLALTRIRLGFWEFVKEIENSPKSSKQRKKRTTKKPSKVI